MVKRIGIRMIVVNSLGRFILVSMIEGISGEEENGKGLERDKVLGIGEKRLGYLGGGLREDSCKDVGEIIDG
ncbi:hypothetical protein, partial [Bacillus sp. ABP14]|uniref:hypothetical protein n=1 Tax=Bacillus sp. ABP14 TaxID=1892404 RepID=UPI00351A0043